MWNAGFRSVARCDDVVTMRGQAGLEDIEVGGIVVDDQDLRRGSHDTLSWVQPMYSRTLASSARGLTGFEK